MKSKQFFVLLLGCAALSSSHLSAKLTTPADLYRMSKGGGASATDVAPARRLPDFSTTFSAPSAQKNRIELLCRQPVEEWDLQDDALTTELRMAFASKETVDKALSFREKLLPAWQAWRETDKKAQALKRLEEEMESLLSKDKSFYSTGRGAFFAKWLVHFDVSLNADTFITALLGAVKVQPYHDLYLAFLGYEKTDADYHRAPAHLLEGKRLSDVQCLNRIFAALVVMFRSEYDLAYQAKSDEKLEKFFKEFNLTPSQKMDIDRAVFLGQEPTFPGDAVVMKKAWSYLIAESRKEAEAKAKSELEKRLENFWEATVGLQARLDLLRVPERFFKYPNSAQGSAEVLSDEQAYSLLFGLGCRISERVFLSSRHLPLPAELQTMFFREYRDQLFVFGRMPALPKGELNLARKIPDMPRLTKDAFDKAWQSMEEVQMMDWARRKSFEAQVTLLFGDVDFLAPESLSASVKEALSGYDLAKGADLYTNLLKVYGEFNALRWHLLANGADGARAAAAKRLLQAIGLIRDFMQSLGLEVDSLENIAAGYKAVMKTFAEQMRMTLSPKNVVKTLAGGDRSGVIALNAMVSISGVKNPQASKIVHCTPELYRALYKNMWLHIAGRLLVVASKEREGVRAKREGDASVIAGTVGLASEEGDDADASALFEGGKLASEALAKGDGNEETVVAKVKQRLGAIGRAAASRKKRFDAYVDEGDVEGMSDQIAGSLADIGRFIGGVQSIIELAGEQSEKESNRVRAVFKAVTMYVFCLTEFVNKKLSNVQGLFMGMFKGIKGYLVQGAMERWLIPTLRRMRHEVNKDDEEMLAAIQRAADDVKLTFEGKKKAEDIKEPKKGSRYSDQLKSNEAQTRESGLAFVMREHNLMSAGGAA